MGMIMNLMKINMHQMPYEANYFMLIKDKSWKKRETKLDWLVWWKSRVKFSGVEGPEQRGQ